VIWLLVVLTIIASCMVGNLSLRLVTRDRADHAKCLALVSSVVSNKAVAQAFRLAADRADGIDGVADMRRLATYDWDESGPTVYALWLREQADKIEAS
jgi:hypothetical protein